MWCAGRPVAPLAQYSPQQITDQERCEDPLTATFPVLPMAWNSPA